MHIEGWEERRRKKRRGDLKHGGEGGRDARKAQADPVRGVASFLDLQTGDQKEAT